MEFRIWVETRLDGRILERDRVSSVERPASGIGLEEIGLDLEEGKAVLRKVQARIVQTQVDVLSAAPGDASGVAESARQGSSNPDSPNDLWNLSSFLPTLFSLQMSRRKESGHLAPPSPSAFGDLTETSVPLRHLGQ
jgi:hypothetical protein